MADARVSASPIQRVRDNVEDLFSVDLRALAALRIVLAVVVLFDLAGRLGDLRAHYTDAGVLPRGLVIRDLNEWQISLSLMNGTTAIQGMIFAITALAALCLLVGYRTRTATIVAWGLLLSIQWRNPLVLSDADTLMRVLLFWGIFLPLGARWSVDHARHPALALGSRRHLSWASAALFFQIAFMYWFTALLKTGPEWRQDGTALYYALSAEHLTTSLGTYLRQYTGALKVMTFGTLGLEAFGPFLLFIPFWTKWCRTVAVFAFMSLHFGIMITMDIGLFPWLSAFCMVSFLPAEFWDAASTRVRHLLPNVSIPEMVTSLRGIAARLAHATRMPIRGWTAAPAGAGRSGHVDLAAHANVNMMSGLGGGAAVALAARSMPGGKTGSLTLHSSIPANFLALLFLLFVFFWNVTTVSDVRIPDQVRPVGNLFGLKQSWNMFAPSPSLSTGWFVIPGTMKSGRQLDLVTALVHNDWSRATDVQWGRPESLDSVYGDKYWRKYLGAIRDNSAQRRALADYICTEWNAAYAGSSQLETVDIYYLREKTLPDQGREAAKRSKLTEYSCG